MISIIVPVYKVEKYIRQCIESIVNQTFKDIEIILVDDGSPDNCPAICDEYADKDSRIKVVHKQNGGLMSARQAGLRAAAGEYVGFVDGDDYIEPDMYEHFADSISKYHPDMLLCEFYYSHTDKKEVSTQNLSKEYFSKNELEKDIYPAMLFNGSYYYFGIQPCCWSKVYKKELLEKKLYLVDTKIKMGEDAAFTYPCLLDAQSLCYINKPLYNYRVIDESMSNAYDADMDKTILIPYQILKSCFAEYKYDFLDNQLNNYLFYLLNIFIRNEISKSNKNSFAERLTKLKKFVSDDEIIKSVKCLNLAHLPLRKRLVAKLFSVKSSLLLYIYCLLLSSLS